ncbi:hypothetical protein [Noviherbaspirillum sp. Root189]|uniref:hypothetical protein n=1 Tax=Noviherbaspirillum sp. Root189 TaxID=1736487 RepID=UPI0007091983|nr:hypothetical protein [Noviherbaspirillum sp. Root189]KRB66897.1 hypothetical protein ASE07_27765 [Noviherbaspirillum sp. Root189]
MTLPIMLFDDRKLKPAFGYVFDPNWLQPYESIVSILWKYARQNRLPGHLITLQLTRKAIDPYEGIAACERQVDIREVQNALGLRLKRYANRCFQKHYTDQAVHGCVIVKSALMRAITASYISSIGLRSALSMILLCYPAVEIVEHARHTG